MRQFLQCIVQAWHIGQRRGVKTYSVRKEPQPLQWSVFNVYGLIERKVNTESKGVEYRLARKKKKKKKPEKEKKKTKIRETKDSMV